jgi:hypothetical protein
MTRHGDDENPAFNFSSAWNAASALWRSRFIASSTVSTSLVDLRLDVAGMLRLWSLAAISSRVTTRAMPSTSW